MVSTPITKKRVIYSDFDRDLTPHPVSGDAARKTNEDAVKESIRNLIMTDRLERPFRPDIGCDIRKMLFDNFGPETELLVRESVMSTIEAYEPRAEVIDIKIITQPDANAFNLTITFRVINNSETTLLDLVLNRIR